MTRHSPPTPVEPPFALNDEVLVHKAAFRTNHQIKDLNKFDDRWLGPFTITKIINPNAFRLAFPQDFRKHNVINISFLRPYKRSNLFPRIHPDDIAPSPTEPNLLDHTLSTNPEFEVEAMARHLHRPYHATPTFRHIRRNLRHCRQIQ